MLRGAFPKCHELVVNGLLDMDWNTLTVGVIRLIYL